jgi:uncharacterized protein (TIGR03437 family)
VTVPVVAAQAGIFTADSSGSGQISMANQDYTLNSAANPADKGSVVIFYGTGEGQTNPPGVDGQVIFVSGVFQVNVYVLPPCWTPSCEFPDPGPHRPSDID